MNTKEALVSPKVTTANAPVPPQTTGNASGLAGRVSENAPVPSQTAGNAGGPAERVYGNRSPAGPTLRSSLQGLGKTTPGQCELFEFFFQRKTLRGCWSKIG